MHEDGGEEGVGGGEGWGGGGVGARSLNRQVRSESVDGVELSGY